MYYNQEKVIGVFYAITYNNETYEFIVKNNGLIYSKQIENNKPINKLLIKPNFWVYFEDGGYTSCDTLARQNGTKNNNNHLIKRLKITKDLLDYLVLTNLIFYSTDMAYLYGLNSNYAYDKNKKTRAFKKLKRKKKPILEQQKQGKFN